MDLAVIAQHVVTAVAGGASSFFALLLSVEKKYQEVSERLKALEKDAVRGSGIAEFKQRVADDAKQQLHRLAEDLREELTLKLDTLKRGIRIELEQSSEELDRRLRGLDRETKPDLPTLEDMRRRIEALERWKDMRAHEPREDYVTVDAFTEFQQEQTRQWNDMNRTLGQIEGYLKRTK